MAGGAAGLPRTAIRAGTALLLAALGVAAGVAVVVLHPYWWGLLLGTLACAATLLALPPRLRTRVPFGLGFAVVVARAATARPEGDYLVAQSLDGYLLLALATALLMTSFISCVPRRSTPAEEHP